MTSVAIVQLRPNPIAFCGRLLVVLGIVSGILPIAPASGGTGKRLKIQKVNPPRHSGHGRRGGGSIPTRSSTIRSTSTPTRPPAPVVSPPANPPQPTTEQEMIALTNQYRQANGLMPLSVDDRLTQAAQIQANAMAALNDMDHTLPGEAQPTLTDRLAAVGFNFAWAGENIAFNAPDAPSVMTDWINSPPHRANILSPDPTVFGVAVAYNAQGQPYYCQVFGESYQ
jgi:uncharacterized protein YkwD